MTVFTYKSDKDYDSAIQAAQKESKSAVEELSETSTKFVTDKGIKEEEKKLAELKKPYEDKMELLSKKRDEAARRATNLQVEKLRFHDSEMLNAAAKSGELDADSVVAFLKLHLYPNSLRGFTLNVELKKTMSNGIKAFKLANSDYGANTKLFLFKGSALVGYWCKRQSRHPGDNVESRAWIGVSKLRDGGQYGAEPEERNDIEHLENLKRKITYENQEEHPFYREGKFSAGKTDPTMEQFFKYAEGIKGELVPIDLTDEITVELLKRRPNY